VPSTEDKQDPRLVSKLPGAFNFMDKRPFDLVVVIRGTTDQQALLRRMELYYAERGRISSFLFDFSEPKYLSDRHKFHDTCIRALFKEVRSRVVARDEFVVWFYNESDCRAVGQLARIVAGEDEHLLRSLDELIARSRVVNVDVEPELMEYPRQ
jgi:hypothetical protein